MSALATAQTVARATGNQIRVMGMLTGVNTKMFDQTFQAMNAIDTFRIKAIDVMGQNKKLIREQIERADTYVDRNRQKLAREATSGSTDPAGQALITPLPAPCVSPGAR